MGITKFSYDLIRRTKLRHLGIKSVCELGSQNDYTAQSEKPPFANDLYKKLGIEDYTCIDLAGDNNALKYDLGKQINHSIRYDLVTDFGTSEHIVLADGFQTSAFHGDYIHSVYPVVVENIQQGYYNCWVNKFNLCNVGGIIISENPLTDNWPGHGYSYLGVNFYDELVKIADIEIIEKGKESAMGNTIDGWNLWAVLKKTGNRFPPFEEFKKLPIFKM